MGLPHHAHIPTESRSSASHCMILGMSKGTILVSRRTLINVSAYAIDLGMGPHIIFVRRLSKTHCRMQFRNHSCARPGKWLHTAAMSATFLHTKLSQLSKPACFPGRRLEDAWKTCTPLAKSFGRHGFDKEYNI